VVVLYVVHEMEKFGFKIQFGCSSFFWHAFDFAVQITRKCKFNCTHAHHLSMRVGDITEKLNAW
jgi:hypothetical protein